MMDARELEDYLADPKNGTEGLEVGAGTVIEVVRSATAKRAKNRAAKLLAELSSVDPAAVVAAWDALVALVESGDNIVRWNAMIAVGNVAGEAGKRRVAKVVPEVVGLLADASMVTAGHAAVCLGKLVAAGVVDAREVVPVLVEVDRCEAREAECNAIVAGKVLGELVGVLDELEEAERGMVVALAERHVESGRKGVAKLAERVVSRGR